MGPLLVVGAVTDNVVEKWFIVLLFGRPLVYSIIPNVRVDRKSNRNQLLPEQYSSDESRWDEMGWGIFRRDKWRRRDRLFLPLLLLICCSPILIPLFFISIPFIFCSVATARLRSASRKGLEVHESEDLGVPQVGASTSYLLERYLEDQFRLVKVGDDRDRAQRPESAPMMDTIWRRGRKGFWFGFRGFLDPGGFSRSCLLRHSEFVGFFRSSTSKLKKKEKKMYSHPEMIFPLSLYILFITNRIKISYDGLCVSARLLFVTYWNLRPATLQVCRRLVGICPTWRTTGNRGWRWNI